MGALLWSTLCKENQPFFCFVFKLHILYQQFVGHHIDFNPLINTYQLPIWLRS